MTREFADILSAVGAAFPSGPPPKLGIAVSGGGDSMALLHAVHRLWAAEEVEFHAATVDHGLRPEATREAAWVADRCEELGVTHSTLRWRGWDGSGNLQDHARRARYRLLTEWAKAWGLTVVALGHTADDQAETVLMRLARASGVAGLAAMPQRHQRDGVQFVRPVMALERQQLRGFLRAADVDWLEDPSNDNPAFERVRARRAMAALEPLGISVGSLSRVAANMETARDALDWYAFLAARDVVRIDFGDVLIDRRALRTMPEETARRLLVRALVWIGGADYPPRREPVISLLDAARKGRTGTLAGCRLLQQGDQVWLCREFNAVQGVRSEASEIWDRRWKLTGPAPGDCAVRPLGRTGLARCENWRETGRPHAALLASPSVWRGPDLVAAPLAGVDGGWTAEVTGGGEEFFAGLLAH